MTEVSVVVGTFDLYSSAWPVMCHGLRKFWPDCPWEIVFITDKKSPPIFHVVRVGKPEGWNQPQYWSTRVVEGLRRISSPVILWTSEDNWLTASPDAAAIADFARYVKDGKAYHVRLYPGWDHDKTIGEFPYDSRLLVFAKRSPYRCSLKPGLWLREIFLELLKEGETAWDFERYASKRSRKYGNKFMAVKDWGYFPMVTGGDPTGPWVKSPIVKGRWTKAAKAYCEREGLELDFSKHPMGRLIDDTIVKADWVLP